MNSTKNKKNGAKIILRGMGASRGKVAGPVKVILNIQELEKLQSGDILVTSMTNPDMVIAMRKAVAVVTDVGGLTCHAAIVSRELGIPCVVGTERATKVLKDNMLVEVDGTNGIIYKYPEEKMVKEKRLPRMEQEFTIFGHKVTSLSLKMDRDKPIWPEHWDMDWPEVDINKEYEWIPPRPEISGEPIASLLFSAIEKIPFTMGFKIGPLYVRFHNCTHHLRLDKIQETLALLSDKLISRDEQFFKDYKKRLLESYEQLDKITIYLENQQNRFNKMTSNELLRLYKKWWRIHDDFFSLTYLIQSMGDDIIWPEIRRNLKELFDDETKVNDTIQILSLPTKKVISIDFFDECIELVNKYDRVKSLILSNLSVKETMDIIGELKEGVEWLEELKRFVDKWGWMRDRLLYLEPLSKEEKMLEFIKKYLTLQAKPSILKRNIEEFKTCVQTLRKLLPVDKVDNFMFYLDVGRFLQMERDNHHHIFLKDTDVVRNIFLELGKRLKGQEILPNERDIFFLFIQEVFKLFSPTVSTIEKMKIVSKIPNRMIAFTYMSKIKLHDRLGYDPNKIPERDGEYY